MEEKKNRTCVICGKEYHYCHSCRRTDPLYKNTFCSSECKDMYHICVAYIDGKITKESAQLRLTNLGIKPEDEFNPKFKEIIEQIFRPERMVMEYRIPINEPDNE